MPQRMVPDPTSRSRAAMRLVTLSIVALSFGCATAGHTSSPWEWGGGVRIAPALWEVGDDGMTAHPMASYTYLSFDGGHDGLWEVGGQIRKPMGGEDRPFWVGGEATVSHLRTTVDSDFGDFSGTSNGGSATALIGKPIGESRWNPNVYAGAGISNYGSQGWNIRLGIDLQPTFLWQN